MYISMPKSVENVVMNHHVKFQVAVSQKITESAGRLPDGLIFRSQNRFFGPNLLIFWISAKWKKFEH